MKMRLQAATEMFNGASWIFLCQIWPMQNRSQEKEEMINSLEENVLGLTEKVGKLSSLVAKQEQYKIKNEMDLEISPGDIDIAHIE